VFGEWDGGPPSERLSALAELFRAAGVDARISEDVRIAIWEKYVLLVAFSGLSAATRLPLGEIRNAPAGWAVLRGLANEAWRVGRASGVPLAADVVDRAIGILGRQEESAFASLCHDLVASHPMELEALQGTLVRLGREHGVDTPIGRSIHGVLEPWARRNADRTEARQRRERGDERRGASGRETLVERFVQAINGHDLEAIVSCFAPDYHDVEPVHPTRQISGGRTEVRKRWGTVLDGMPDFRTEVERVAVEADTAWIEHDWSGTRADGTRLHLRGVNIFGIRDGQFAWGHIYKETVEEDGIDIEERVRRMAEGDPGSG
jgi:ketosteroid isomerase-like protein